MSSERSWLSGTSCCDEEPPGLCPGEEGALVDYWLWMVDGGLSRQPDPGDAALGEGSPEEGYLVLLVF